MSREATLRPVLDKQSLLALIDSVDAGPEIVGSENELWDMQTFSELLALQFGIQLYPDGSIVWVNPDDNKIC